NCSERAAAPPAPPPRPAPPPEPPVAPLSPPLLPAPPPPPHEQSATKIADRAVFLILRPSPTSAAVDHSLRTARALEYVGASLRSAQADRTTASRRLRRLGVTRLIPLWVAPSTRRRTHPRTH